jgi:hypothetical protein
MNILNHHLLKIISEYTNHKLPFRDELKSKTTLINKILEDDRFYYQDHFVSRYFNDKLLYKCKVSFSKRFNYHINHTKI